MEGFHAKDRYSFSGRTNQYTLQHSYNMNSSQLKEETIKQKPSQPQQFINLVKPKQDVGEESNDQNAENFGSAPVTYNSHLDPKSNLRANQIYSLSKVNFQQSDNLHPSEESLPFNLNYRTNLNSLSNYQQRYQIFVPLDARNFGE